MPTQTGPWIDARTFAPPDHPRDGSADWYPYLQRAIDHIVSQGITAESGTLYLPPGRYRLSQPLQVRFKYQGTYTFCSIHITGDAPGLGASSFHGSAILTDFNDRPALILQSCRAVKIENLVFQGRNDWALLAERSPDDMATHHGDDDSIYLASSAVRDNRYSPYAAIHIDPYNSAVSQENRYPGLEHEYINVGGGGGSSGICIHNCDFRNFVVGIGISLNGTTQNAENMAIVDSTFVSMKSAIAVGQDQSRNITLRNVNVYAARVAFDCTGYGKGSASNLSIFGGSIKGVKYVFQTFSFGGGVSVSGLYGETLYSLGVFGGGGTYDGHSFDACSFHFGPSPSGKGAIPYRLANLSHAVFTGCTFGLYENEPLWMLSMGKSLAFNHCTFFGQTDVAPKVWVSGPREKVSFQGSWVAAQPSAADFSRILPVDHKSNILDTLMLPGTLFYAHHDLMDAPSLRWVSGKYPMVDLGNRELRVPTPVNGTATIPLPGALAGRVAPGDFIYAPSKAFQVLGRPFESARFSVILGKVSEVTSTQVTLAHVPTLVKDSETLRLFAIYLPRVHRPTQATLDFKAPTELAQPTQASHWKRHERIRDRQGFITEGTYVANDPATDGFIRLSRPANNPGNVQGPLTLDLYDADVREVNMTPVY